LSSFPLNSLTSFPLYWVLPVRIVVTLYRSLVIEISAIVLFLLVCLVASPPFFCVFDSRRHPLSLCYARTPRSSLSLIRSLPRFSLGPTPPPASKPLLLFLFPTWGSVSFPQDTVVLIKISASLTIAPHVVFLLLLLPPFGLSQFIEEQ